MSRILTPKAPRITAIAGPRPQQSRVAIGQCGGCANTPDQCVCRGGPVIFTPPPNSGVPVPSIYPPGTDMAGYNAWLSARGGNAYVGPVQGGICIPYKDAIRDCLMMSTIASTPPGDPPDDTAPLVPMPAGVPTAPVATTFTIDPDRGMFDAWYIDIVVRDATSGERLDTFLVTPPTLQDCPAPCDTTPQDGAFWSSSGLVGSDGCCCGRPFRAVIGNLFGQDTPLTVVLLNIGDAAVGQIILRGFCHRFAFCP